MRTLKGWVVGALALGGLLVVQTQAQAGPRSVPALVPIEAAAKTATDATCGWHRGWHRHYGWHRHWGGYGWHHRWHRPWGWHHYGWHRPYGFYRPVYYGWHRPWGWHHHYGWRRW